MNVADLQQHLLDLAGFLERAGGGKSVVADLKAIKASLEPFQGRTLKQFADFLVKAEEFARTGALTATKKATKKSGGDKGPKADEVAQRIKAVYDKALEPDMTNERIEEALKPLGGLTAGGLKDVAQALGIERGLSGKSKTQLVEIVRRKVLDRRGMYQRSDL